LNVTSEELAVIVQGTVVSSSSTVKVTFVATSAQVGYPVVPMYASPEDES
jgi:hypothetical protein